VRVYEGMPNYLSTAQELASMNLEPLDEAVRCYKKGLRWVLLYDSWLTAIAGSNLLPTYTWNNRPQDLKTKVNISQPRVSQLIPIMSNR
jgi:hypothetical protein